MAARIEEFSDSEDEDNHREEKPHRENKQPRLVEDSKGGVSRSSAKSHLSSPLPPEPSPITPVLVEDSATSEQKGTVCFV